MIRIFYGMSGTFKLTTIQRKYGDTFKILSAIKPHYKMAKTIFNGNRELQDLDFAMYRLLELSERLPQVGDCSIERGITDFMHSYQNRSYWKPGIDIQKLVEAESETFGDTEVKKILMVMKDEDFIQNTILSEPTRKAIYPDLKTYLSEQDKYVEFTKKWNLISEEIIILDAHTYLNNLNNE